MPSVAITTHDFTLDGVRQTYHIAGRGPLCIAHSGGPGLDWSYLRSPELEERFTVVYPEPIGTGRSGRLDDATGYRLDTYVRFLAALVEHLVEHFGEPKVYLLGHSYGGFVVQSYAVNHPDKVAGLILYSTSPYTGPEFWTAAMEGVAAYPQRYPGMPEAEAVPGAFQRALVAEDDDIISREFAAALPVYFADFWLRVDEFAPFQAAVRMSKVPATVPDPHVFDVRAELGRLEVPAVIIVGAFDFIAGPRWADELSKALTSAETVLLEKSGHFGHVEEPSHFGDAVASVLGDSATSTR